VGARRENLLFVQPKKKKGEEIFNPHTEKKKEVLLSRLRKYRGKLRRKEGEADPHFSSPEQEEEKRRGGSSCRLPL